MRKTFAQVLKEGKVDIEKEYSRLYSIMFGPIDWSGQSGIAGDTRTVHGFLRETFPYFTFRGTAISLADFDESNGFHFEEKPKNFSIDYLVNLCEYSYNMVSEYERVTSTPFSRFRGEINTRRILEHIDSVIEKIGYMATASGYFVSFVEKSNVAISVAEILPSDISYKVISYNHHSMRGDIDAKKETLIKLAAILEGKRKKLKQIYPSLEDDLFFAFNNLNLRHNNIEPSSSDYREFVAKMPKKDLEGWYDEVYQMCLFAFLRLEHDERQKKFNELQQKIKSAK